MFVQRAPLPDGASLVETPPFVMTQRFSDSAMCSGR